ncbi:uncharacterized protein BDV17DRAFT_252642 [Aspergillus undulatus]|uniref:uncharacterized protein n=1 Tax=Aspergillus undulatus TaxID=1810928 RepID=UPI003CCCB464
MKMAEARSVSPGKVEPAVRERVPLYIEASKGLDRKRSRVLVEEHCRLGLRRLSFSHAKLRGGIRQQLGVRASGNDMEGHLLTVTRGGAGSNCSRPRCRSSRRRQARSMESELQQIFSSNNAVTQPALSTHGRDDVWIWRGRMETPWWLTTRIQQNIRYLIGASMNTIKESAL